MVVKLAWFVTDCFTGLLCARRSPPADSPSSSSLPARVDSASTSRAGAGTIPRREEPSSGGGDKCVFCGVTSRSEGFRVVHEVRRSTFSRSPLSGPSLLSIRTSSAMKTEPRMTRAMLRTLKWSSSTTALRQVESTCSPSQSDISVRRSLGLSRSCTALGHSRTRRLVLTCV